MAAYPGHKAATAALVLVFLSSCSARYDFADVEVAKTAMLGLSAQDIRMCAGFPDRTVAEDGFTVWSYEQDRPGNALTVSTPVLFGSANTALNVSSAGNCRMQVRFRDGRVDRIAYAGDNDGPRGRDTLCTPLVDGCLAYARRFKAADRKAMSDRRDVDPFVTGSLPDAPAAPAATGADATGAATASDKTAAAADGGPAAAKTEPEPAPRATAAPTAAPARAPLKLPLRLRSTSD